MPFCETERLNRRAAVFALIVSSRTNLVFLGLVRRGHVSQILNDLLGVFCLSSTRFASEHTHKHTQVWQIKQSFHGQIIIIKRMQDHVTHVQRIDWSSRSVGGDRNMKINHLHLLSISFLAFYVFWDFLLHILYILSEIIWQEIIIVYFHFSLWIYL